MAFPFGGVTEYVHVFHAFSAYQINKIASLWQRCCNCFVIPEVGSQIHIFHDKMGYQLKLHILAKRFDSNNAVSAKVVPAFSRQPMIVNIPTNRSVTTRYILFETRRKQYHLTSIAK